MNTRRHPKSSSAVENVTQRFLDAGITPLHENCMNYGGMSWKHALELLDKVPGLKWVFDTANPVFNFDRSKAKPWVPPHIRGNFGRTCAIMSFTFTPRTQRGCRQKMTPTTIGQARGKRRVRDILKDAFARGYDGGEYGRRLEA